MSHLFEIICYGQCLALTKYSGLFSCETINPGIFKSSLLCFSLFLFLTQKHAMLGVIAYFLQAVCRAAQLLVDLTDLPAHHSVSF